MRNYTSMMILGGWLFLCFVVANACACGASIQTTQIETIPELIRELPEATPFAPAPVQWIVDGDQADAVPVVSAPVSVFGASSAEEAEAWLAEADIVEMGCIRATTGNREAWVCVP